MLPFLPLLSVAGSAIGKVLRAIPPAAWAVLALLVAAYIYGEMKADAREASVRAEVELQAAKEADQVAQFLAQETERNRQREQALSDRFHQAAIDHADAIKDLEARQARTVADLEFGRIKLRQHWQTCLGKLPGPGEAAKSGAGDDAAADLRAADIGRVQGIGGTCDAAVKRWQDTWSAAEKAINGG